MKFKRLTGLFLSLLICLSCLNLNALALDIGRAAPHAETEAASAEDWGSENPLITEKRAPIMAGYFRTWHDKYSYEPDGAVNMMGDIPAEVDLVFVFHNFTAEDSPFWAKLKDEYIPKLHAQGTQVVYTIGFGHLTGETGILKDGGHNDKTPQEKAQVLVDYYMTQYGCDGLDIDIENHNFYEIPEEQKELGIQVLEEVAKLIGPAGADRTKLLVIDTNIGANRNTVVERLAGRFDFLLLQGYGGKKADLEADREFSNAWKYQTYRDFIRPEQFLIGFTFYEENSYNPDPHLRGGYFGDTLPDKDSCTAGLYAKWQPDDGVKGGLFAYAIERDGVPDGSLTYPNDEKFVPTTYEWSKYYKNQMLQDDLYDPLEVLTTLHDNAALYAFAMENFGDYKGNVTRFNGDLVLENLALTTLSGLEHFAAVSGVTLRNLPQLQEISRDVLPENLLQKDKTADTHTIAIGEGMTGLQKLDLHDMKLENLEISMAAIEDMTSLQTLDLSGNCLDLSVGTPEYQVVTALIAKIEQNGHPVSAETVRIGGQKLNAYLTRDFQMPAKHIAIGEVFDARAVADSFSTCRGTLIRTESQLEQLKQARISDMTWLDESNDFAALKQANSILKIVVKNSRQEIVNSEQISSDTDETFTVDYLRPVPDGDDELVYTITLTVGEGVKVLTNIAHQSEVLYGFTVYNGNRYDMQLDASLNYIFDEDKTTRYSSFDSKGGIVFAVPEKAQAERIVLTKASYDEPTATDYDITHAVLYVLNDESAYEALSSDGERKAFLSEDSNWKEVHAIVSEHEAEYEGDILASEPAKYYRFDINKIVDDVSGYSGFQIKEIQLLGSKHDGPAGHSVTVSPAVQNGRIEVSQQTAMAGDTITLNVIADEGYELVPGSLSVNDGAVAVEDNAFLMPDEDVVITAQFRKITYTVTVSEEIAHGTVQVSTETAQMGDEVTVTAEPFDGYALVEGSLCVNGMPIEGGSFRMPADNVVITAAFKATPEALQAAADAAETAAAEAKTAAEDAALQADAARKAANEAAASQAEDRTAADAAEAQALEAEAQLAAANEKAEAAGTASAAATAAAEQMDLEAARMARDEAAAAAVDARKAAQAAAAARTVAEEMKTAQTAMEDAETAGNLAEQAAEYAAKAQAAADEAAASTAADRSAAEQAQVEAAAAAASAAAAEDAAQEAMTAAREAFAAAEAGKEADTAAAAAAAALEEAGYHQEIASMRCQMAQYLAQTQKTQQEAEAAALSSAKYEALYILSGYADESAYRPRELKQLSAILNESTNAIENASTPEEVETILNQAKASIDAIYTAEEMKMPFTDVYEGDWYEYAVRYVYVNQILTGTGKTAFSPRSEMTRGQMMTALYRMAGSPDVKENAAFTDVKADAYYAKAVAWGVQQGIVKGTSETAFSPDEPVTRAQAVTFLYLYEQAEKVEQDHLAGFADRKDVPAYAADAMNWAAANEILSGAQSGEEVLLAPGRSIRRGEFAELVMRLAEK